MEELETSIGPIMKAARKFKKLNQSAVAEAIGCSQSALSKMEHNLLVPSAPQWFKFTRFTAIPVESLERGIIDRHSVVKFNNQEISLGFKIPKRYRLSRSLKVREVYPILNYLEHFSPIKYKEFLDKCELDLEFFLDFDNLLNYSFMEDLIRYLVELGLNTEEHITGIIREGQTDLYWDQFKDEWQKYKTVSTLLEAFAERQAYYQMDFHIKVEGDEKKVFISYFPEYHLNQLKLNFSITEIDFLNSYRKKTLENILAHLTHLNVKVTKLQESHASPLAVRFSVEVL